MEMSLEAKEEFIAGRLQRIAQKHETIWMDCLLPEREKNCLLRNGIRSDKQFFDQWLYTVSDDWTNFGVKSKERTDAIFWMFARHWHTAQTKATR